MVSLEGTLTYSENNSIKLILDRHDGAAQPSLSYRAFNIELDSLLPYEEFFDSTFSYDWTDGVPDHQPLQADSENQLLSTSSTIPTYDQALNENLLDGSLSPTRSVRGGPDQRSQTFEGPSIDQSELLRFTTLTHRNGVVDCDWKPVRISIAAELQGNFFLATPEPSRSAELTFSRRNLFQVTGSVSKIPKPCYLLDHKGGRTAILNVDVCVTGTESKEGKQIDVVHVPRKTTRLPSSPYVDYHTSPSPHPIRLEPEADVQVSSGELTLPFVWKRLQFKNSTANSR